MVEWRAVGAGLVAYPVSVVVALATNPAASLLAGLPAGFVAGGVVGRGVRAGGVHGGITGVGCTLLSWLLLVGWVALFPPPLIAPGFGLSLILLELAALLVGIESALGGLVAGLLFR